MENVVRISAKRFVMPDRIRIESPIYAQDALYYYVREGDCIVVYSKRWYIA